MNCGYDFKAQKSRVLSEAENTFTIFATVAAEAGAVAGDASQGFDEDFHQESSTMAIDDTELYDSSADLDESSLGNSEDFDLDLSEADDPDSESWDIGATLTEDLSEISSVVPKDSMNNADPEADEFEVQGLGFDLIDGHELEETEVAKGENTASPELEHDPIAEEALVPELEPDAGQEEIAFELIEDEPAHLANREDTPHELTNSEETMQEPSLELNDSSGQNSDDEPGEISLEPELELEDREPEIDQTSEVPADLKDLEIEPNPTFDLKELQLELETDSLELEPIQANPPNDSEVPLEDPKLKMGSDEDDTNSFMPDEESTPDR